MQGQHFVVSSRLRCERNGPHSAERACESEGCAPDFDPAASQQAHGASHQRRIPTGQPSKPASGSDPTGRRGRNGLRALAVRVVLTPVRFGPIKYLGEGAPSKTTLRVERVAAARNVERVSRLKAGLEESGACFAHADCHVGKLGDLFRNIHSRIATRPQPGRQARSHARS